MPGRTPDRRNSACHARLGTRLVLVMTVLASGAEASGLLDPAFANGAVTASGVAGIRSQSLAVAADGRILRAGTVVGGSFAQVMYGGARMFDDSGAATAIFGSEYGWGAGALGLPTNHAMEAVAFDAAGRVVVGGTMLVSPSGAWIQRVRSDGGASATFTPLAPAEVTPGLALRSVFALAVDASGRIVGGGSTNVQSSFFYVAGQVPAHSAVVRLRQDGTLDTAFGALGEVVLGSPQTNVDARVRALGFDDGRIVVAHGTSSRLVLQRLGDDGSPDAAFGNGGSATIDAWAGVAVDRRGRAHVLADLAGPPADRYLLRYVDGRPDPAYGESGAVLLPAAYSVLATGPDGAAYATRVDAANGVASLRTLRVREDGIVDTAYGSGGEAVASFDYPPGGGSGLPAIAVDDANRLLVTAMRYSPSGYGIANTAAMLYRFNGPSSPPVTGAAIEFFHAGFGHYFSTADADEIAAIDAGVFDGWTRTGETFTVAVRSVGEASPACRFFSGSTFAPKSSHFYTPYPGECDTVDASAAWGFEKIAWLLRIPDDVGAGNGTCPVGLRPLYRAYNGMLGGAPNHRYTTSPATLDAMLAAGWQLEGEANTRVFACVPP
jgi:uncharacterized delta-60 repeat protein